MPNVNIDTNQLNWDIFLKQQGVLCRWGWEPKLGYKLEPNPKYQVPGTGKNGTLMTLNVPVSYPEVYSIRMGESVVGARFAHHDKLSSRFQNESANGCQPG